ncbi:uncharacterized protein K02A2.6-like [Lacerta agilis]|uniref:uncharacterized protein K02A2.6-like n=1 Tax=Lacerta agilis TaxID=80427 RepID=UPI0014198888|nr:uncharacterized protein K02A2.6-like [Lacerta agilis]
MEDSDRHPESAEEEEEVVNAPDHAMAGSKIIEPFKPGAAEAWDSYLQRFGFAAAAQGITNSDRKKAVFLSCCGAEVFELARGLVAPLTLETATLAQITDQLTRHLAPAATKTTRRIEFHNRRQKDGESVSMFLAELKVLARQCQFVALEEALLDQFIGGLSSSKARRRIAAKEEVDLATAVREALATETAEGEKQKTPQRSTRPAAETAHAMCSQESSPSQSPSRAVGSLGAGSSGTKGRKLDCPGCGGAHERRKCRFRNATCRICGKMGHIARVCRSATGGTSGSPRSSRRQENSSAHVVDDCNYLTEIEGKTVQFPAQGKASIQVSIEGHPCQMEVDSGSGFTIVSDKTARSFFLGDALSRLPLQGTGDCDPAPAEQVTMLETLPGAPVTAEEVAARTRKDPTLSRVLAWVGRGWPSGGQEEKFRPFVMRQHELSLHKGCILWGDRVVIPNPLRNRILETLHMGHPGMVRMKSLARCYVWWPGMDKEIEMWVNTCKTCQEVRPEVPGAPIHWWEQSKAPWNRLHIDFAGPFQGKTFLVVVDAYSKWLEVALVSRPTSAAVIKVLRRLFATHGLPGTVVSDNGAAFVSNEFRGFLRIARMLFLQHATPCTATGKSPAELLLGRRLVTVLDFVHPDRMPSRPAREPPPPEGDRTRHFNPEDLVWVRNYATGPIWVPGVISRATGPVSYHVTLSQGQVWRRHVDQLRHRIPSRSDAEEPNASALNGESPSPSQVETPALVNAPPGQTVGAPPAENTELAEENELGEPLAGTGVANTPEEIPQPPMPQVTTPEVRRSGRDRRKPQFLKDYVCHSR